MKSIPLGQLFELKYGKSLRKDRRLHGEVPVYGANGTVDYHNESLVDEPTIVVGRKGSIGEVHLVSTPCWPIDTTYFVQSLGKYKYDLEWLYRLLKTLRLQDLNRSAAIPGLNRADVYKIKIFLPPLDDQKRIANLLGKVEGLIARRKQHLQQLDNLLKSIFLEMFGDPVWNEKGWDKKPLSDFATVRIGPFGSLLHAEDYISGGIPLVNPSHMSNGEIVIDESLTITEKKFNELSAYHLAVNDVVVARRGEIGRCALVRTEDKLLCGTGSMFVRVTGKYLPIMLQFMIYRTSLKDFLESNAKGVTMKNLNSSILEKMQVIVPPIDLQNQFAAIVEKVQSLKSRYQQSLTDLETLYAALSQKAFKGELDLSKVPLPTEGPETDEEGKSDPADKHPTASLFELPAPAEIAILQSVEGRKTLLDWWLTAWQEQRGDTPFAVQPFIETARQRLWELVEDEAPDWSAAEYDELNAWVFNALRQGRLTQRYAETNNRVQITAANG